MIYIDTSALLPYYRTEPATERWIEGLQTPLMTLDALHLASAASEGAELVTEDRALLRAAATLGVAARAAGRL